MRRSSFVLTRLTGVVAGLVLAAAGVVTLAAPAQAASLTQVSSFGSNPGNLAMYAYRPDNQPANSPAVVLLHGCTRRVRYPHDRTPQGERLCPNLRRLRGVR